ncbi:hypothetical protein [Streptomyces sp. Y1]|uniref:Uncharacterized protein n=1 Tax=Streptomyces sp. Y1 TaxID=3238634 RepID=A0AB39TXL3_9ACTN
MLAGLRRGLTLTRAATEAGCTPAHVWRLRVDDPAFDFAAIQAVTQAAAPGLWSSPLLPVHRFCVAPECPETRLKAKGLCVRHYYQQHRTGHIAGPDRQYGRTTCTEPGCGRPHRARGYCTRCYERHIRSRAARGT